MGLALACVVGSPSAVRAEIPFLADVIARYPALDGTKLDSCNICHTSIPNLNSYGDDFEDNGRDFAAIETLDSDGDGANNLEEIMALTWPWDANDVPDVPPTVTPTFTLVLTPSRTATPTSTSTPTTPRPLFGDANCDDRITAADVAALVQLIAVDDLGDCGLADADQSGTVDEADLAPTISALFDS